MSMQNSVRAALAQLAQHGTPRAMDIWLNYNRFGPPFVPYLFTIIAEGSQRKLDVGTRGYIRVVGHSPGVLTSGLVEPSVLEALADFFDASETQEQGKEQIMKEEELRENFRNFVAASGAELAGVLFQGSISKLADEWWTIVARSQKAQGEAEEAVTVAQAARADLERKTQELKQSIPALNTQIRDIKAELAQLQEQRNKLAPVVEGLRAEANQYRSRMAKIMEAIVMSTELEQLRITRGQIANDHTQQDRRLLEDLEPELARLRRRKGSA